MPGSSKTMLIWDGSQKNFAKFEDKVFERFLDGNGGRIAQQWYMNSDASITEHNLEGFGRTPWSMQRLKVGIKKADERRRLSSYCRDTAFFFYPYGKKTQGLSNSS